MSHEHRAFMNDIVCSFAERMRELGLQFIDAAGNAFIHDPPLMIFLQGNRAVEVLCDVTFHARTLSASPSVIPDDADYRPAGYSYLNSTPSSLRIQVVNL